MKYAMMFVMLVTGCGLWGGGYGYGQSPSYLPPAAYGPSMGAMGYGGGYFVPPPPPGDLGFVNGHGYPAAWRGPHRVRLANGMDMYIRVRMDGADISFTDQYVGLPLIPPGQDAVFYTPLNQTDLDSGCEQHHFEFEGYLPPDFSRPVVRSSREVTFCAGWDEQLVQIGHY
jgi:hypothetical protein